MFFHWWLFFTSFLALSEVRNIPRRYEKDYRLYCNVCNNFVHNVELEVNKTDEHHDIKLGFRLDTKGKKVYDKVNYKNSEIRMSEILDKDICKDMSISSVLYLKNAKNKPGVRMLVKDEKYKKDSDHGFSKKTKYVNRAKTYCADIHQRFYDEVLKNFVNEDSSVLEDLCAQVVDERCQKQSSCPFPRKIKKPKKKKKEDKTEDNALNKLREIQSEEDSTGDGDPSLDGLQATIKNLEEQLGGLGIDLDVDSVQPVEDGHDKTAEMDKKLAELKEAREKLEKQTEIVREAKAQAEKAESEEAEPKESQSEPAEKSEL